MIKCSDKNVIKHLQTLFNIVMKSEYYPNSWNERLICSGKREDRNKYRGITLLHCLGKLFSTILHNGFKKELQKSIDLSSALVGFRKNHRTSDPIFTLFSLTNEYLKKGKSLYTCFVDFQKTYDLVGRNSSKYELEEFVIIGKFLNEITSIYSSNKVSLFYNRHVSNLFNTSI